MSSSQDKIITKKLHHEGVVKKRSNHVLYEIVDETQKMRLKVEKKEKPKEKEILDNYRYLETKQIKRNDERRRSIVKHQRLSSPVGKETPFMRSSFKDSDGYIDNKSIDLLNLSENSDIPYLVQQINEKEPLTIKYKSKIQKVIESNYILI